MHPWMKGFQVYSKKGPHPFPKEDNYEIAKNTLTKLIFFSRAFGPISSKLGTKHWEKGIQGCSNEGPCPFPGGDDNEIVKKH